MEVPIQYAYLIGSSVFLVFFAIFFTFYPHLRAEMLTMGILIGVISVVTAHYWWTIDWWRPLTVTGTRIGIEDLLTGFGAGGIMAVSYETLFKERNTRIRRLCLHCPGSFTWLLLLAFLTPFLFWGLELASFWVSSAALIAVAGIIFYFRKNLFINGLLSGTLMVIISAPVYLIMSLASPGWVEASYLFETLSGIVIFGIPVEEFVFWFLAGTVFGPFYEYWQGERMKNLAFRKMANA